MTEATEAYSISDPVQDGDQAILEALLSGEDLREGDYHSSPDVLDADDDLHSLFDEPLESQESDLFTLEDAELMLPDLDFLLGPSFDTGFDAAGDAEIDTNSNIQPQRVNGTALATPPVRKQHGLTLPQLPQPVISLRLPSPEAPVPNTIDLPFTRGEDAEGPPAAAGSKANLPDGPQIMLSAAATTALTQLVAQVSTYDLPSRLSRPSIDTSSSSEPSAASPSASSNTTDVDDNLPVVVSSVKNHLVVFGNTVVSRAVSVESTRGRSREPFTPPPSTSPLETTSQAGATTTQGNAVLGSLLIRRGNCSPIRRSFPSDPSQPEEPVAKKRKVKRNKTLHTQQTNGQTPTSTTTTITQFHPTSTPLPPPPPQPSKESLRHSLMLDVRAYHYLVEKVKLFMLDVNHPERYKDAVTIGNTSRADILLTHELNMQDLATTLLKDDNLAENWWGIGSFGYETRELKWPRDKESIVSTLAKVLIRVCYDHHEKQSVRPYALSQEEVVEMALKAKKKALEQREEEARNVVECHISFVQADDLRQAVREKVIASTKEYPQYMDLVNFLVKLIRDDYTMTGLGVMGPLGYAKVNDQTEWDAMLNVIRTTPTMCSIALCSVETQPVSRKKIGRKREMFVPNAMPTNVVIEID